jgi:hypothetical protein
MNLQSAADIVRWTFATETPLAREPGRLIGRRSVRSSIPIATLRRTRGEPISRDQIAADRRVVGVECVRSPSLGRSRATPRPRTITRSPKQSSAVRAPPRRKRSPARCTVSAQSVHSAARAVSTAVRPKQVWLPPNPARSMSGARLTPSVPLQRLVAASLVGREVQSRLLQRDRLDETLVVAPVAPTIAAEVGQELSAAVLDDGHEGEFAASECRLHRQRNTR